MVFEQLNQGLSAKDINFAALFPLSGDVFDLAKQGKNNKNNDQFGRGRPSKIRSPQPQIPFKEEDHERRRYNRRQQPTEPRSLPQ